MSEGFDFEGVITDLIRAAQNVATENEWGSVTKSAEKHLERTEHDLLDAILALQAKLTNAINELRDTRAALAAANEDAEYLSWAAETLMQKWGSDELTMIDFARISAVIECRRARVGGGETGGGL